MMIPKPNRVVSREEARARQLSWYFTGRPCKYGHVSTRNYNNHSCHECRRSNDLEKRKTETELRREFHQCWLAERKAQRAERLAKQKLDLDHPLLS